MKFRIWQLLLVFACGMGKRSRENESSSRAVNCFYCDEKYKFKALASVFNLDCKSLEYIACWNASCSTIPALCVCGGVSRLLVFSLNLLERCALPISGATRLLIFWKRGGALRTPQFRLWRHFAPVDFSGEFRGALHSPQFWRNAPVVFSGEFGGALRAPHFRLWRRFAPVALRARFWTIICTLNI